MFSFFKFKFNKFVFSRNTINNGLLQKVNSINGQIKEGANIKKIFKKIRELYGLLDRSGKIKNSIYKIDIIYIKILGPEDFRNKEILQAVGNLFTRSLQILRFDVDLDKMSPTIVTSYLYMIMFVTQMVKFFVQKIANRKITLFVTQPRAVGKFDISHNIIKEFARELRNKNLGKCGLGFVYYRCGCCRPIFV